MKKLFFLFILLTLISCNSYNSKWEEIKGSGISENEIRIELSCELIELIENGD